MIEFAVLIILWVIVVLILIHIDYKLDKLGSDVYRWFTEILKSRAYLETIVQKLDYELPIMLRIRGGQYEG